jgi:hypothetical protein
VVYHTGSHYPKHQPGFTLVKDAVSLVILPSLLTQDILMLIEAPISLGELIDKITILEIKSDNISDAEKLKNVRHELNVLNAKVETLLDTEGKARLAPLQQTLKSINQELWVIEDDIRDCEFAKDFGPKFIELARAVYVTNDKRANTKKDINLAFGSELIEEKSYKDYQ